MNPNEVTMQTPKNRRQLNPPTGALQKNAPMNMSAPETSLPLLMLLLLALPAVAQDQFTYTTNNGTISITGYDCSGGAVAIPETINGLPVTSIGAGTFSGCPSL